MPNGTWHDRAGGEPRGIGALDGEPWPGYGAGLPAPPEAPPGPTETPHRGPGFPFLAALLAALLAVSAGVGVWLIVGFADGSGRPTHVGGTGGAIARAAAAVVNIDTATRYGSADGLTPIGAGTGMILTSSGQVLTNNHVVEGATSIRVTVGGFDGSFTASVMGVDPADDVALLQLQGASGLPTATLGDSSALHVGDEVTAIGNAFGRGGSPTITTGKIVGLHRSVTAANPTGATEHLSDAIETDAQVRPGESGGPLVNEAGQAIGIITAGPSGTGGLLPHDAGVAIPSNAALMIVNEIRAGRESSAILLGDRGFLGIQARPLDAAVAARLGFQDTTGALVVRVIQGSPAEAAGMTAPAIIQAIDGESIGSVDSLGVAIHVHPPGARIKVTWFDQEGTHSTTVSLVSGPAV